MKISSLVSILSIAFLAACTEVPASNYASRGNPEALLDYSAEKVSFSLANPSAEDDIATWINKDKPSRAELACATGAAACYRAQDIFNQFGIPYKDVASKDGGDNVSLVYERVLARDCDNRYIDNHSNSLNLNHPTFGCSVAVNGVQMVTDKKEFKDPALRDLSDASRAETSYRSYMKAQ